MNIITIAVCDRNEHEAGTLQKHLEQLIPGADVRIFDKSEALLRTIQKERNPYKLIFLRMESMGMNGIETAREIRKSDIYVPLIILCGSEKYYKEAFEVFAWQYLLTPVNIKELERAISPLKYLWGSLEERMLYYRYRSRIYTLPHNKVQYISSNLHTVNFHLNDGTVIHCRGKLVEFEEQLEGSSFLRCHQSFFVNMDAVTSMKLDSFSVKGAIVPISRSRIREVQEKYSEYLKKRGKKDITVSL